MIGNPIAIVHLASKLAFAETAQFITPDHQVLNSPKSKARNTGAAAIKRAAKKRKSAKRGRK